LRRITLGPVALVMLILLAWGGLLAIGAGVLNRDLYRALMVLACVGGFVSVWGALLWLRRRRTGDPTLEKPTSKQPPP
jgi:uncharacterized membrane protein YiaA